MLYTLSPTYIHIFSLSEPLFVIISSQIWTSRLVFNASRMLRLCSNIPHLSIVVNRIPKETMSWTNDDVSKIWDFYPDLIKICPKLQAIERILTDKNYRAAPTLITSSFSEMTIIVERVSPFFVFFELMILSEILMFCRHVLKLDI